MRLHFKWEVNLDKRKQAANEVAVDIKGLQMQINGENVGPPLPPDSTTGSVVVPNDTETGVFSLQAVDVFDRQGERVDFPFIVGRLPAPHNLQLLSAGVDS